LGLGKKTNADTQKEGTDDEGHWEKGEIIPWDLIRAERAGFG